MKKEQNVIALTKEYFGFLSKDFDFEYDEKSNVFSNFKISIYITSVEKVLPNIELWLLSEPEFTRIEIGWLLKDQIEYLEIDKNLLEENFEYYSKIFRMNAHILIYDLESLLLPALKKYWVNFAKGYIKGSKTSIDKDFVNLPGWARNLLEYIKIRDAGWNPLREF